MALEKKIQDILDRTPKIERLSHVFFSKEADLECGGRGTFEIIDEFGVSAKGNFIGGCSLDDKGNIVPYKDESILAASPETFKYLGYIEKETNLLIRSDHSPEIPKFHVEIPKYCHDL